MFKGAGKALVGRDHDEADLVRTFVLGEERMLVLGVRFREVRADHTDLVAVRASGKHPVLRLAHLRGRNHFHRLGDLARVLHALDLSANFLSTGHGFGSSRISLA